MSKMYEIQAANGLRDAFLQQACHLIGTQRKSILFNVVNRNDLSASSTTGVAPKLQCKHLTDSNL